MHNLRLIDRGQVDTGFAWALAVPTPDHFIPLLYLAGIAAASEPAKAVLRGYSLGSLSMTAYALGEALTLSQSGAAAAQLPANVPADQTNT